MVEILALVLQHEEALVLQAVEAALDSGHPSKQHVLNQLSRLREPQRAHLMIDTPSPLVLTEEPVANVDRYDDLREVRDGY